MRPASVSDSRTVPSFVLVGQANGDIAAEAVGDDLVAEALERADRVELEGSDTHVEESNETMRRISSVTRICRCPRVLLRVSFSNEV